MPATMRMCRICGCDDNHACPGGCAWVLLDLDDDTGVCSACAEEFEYDTQVLGFAKRALPTNPTPLQVAILMIFNERGVNGAD